MEKGQLFILCGYAYLAVTYNPALTVVDLGEISAVRCEILGKYGGIINICNRTPIILPEFRCIVDGKLLE